MEDIQKDFHAALYELPSNAEVGSVPDTFSLTGVGHERERRRENNYENVPRQVLKLVAHKELEKVQFFLAKVHKEAIILKEVQANLIQQLQECLLTDVQVNLLQQFVIILPKLEE